MDFKVEQAIASRAEQRFPVLIPAEVERLRRFGELRTYEAGACIARTGEVVPGFFVVLAGEIAMTQRDTFGHEHLIVTHGPGNFMGELAQLTGRPALVDAKALSAVEAIVIRPQRLRDLLVEEADLGERIMRALILRRVSLLETEPAGRSSSAMRDTSTSCVSRSSSTATAIPTRSSTPSGTRTPRRCSTASTSRRRNCRSCCVPTGNCCAIPARLKYFDEAKVIFFP